MNRYVKDGVTRDLLDGKNVIILAPKYTWARAAFDYIEHALPARKVRNIRHANGAESIELKNGGRLRIVAATNSSARGYSADVVVALGYEHIPQDVIESIAPTLAATRGELVRA